MRYLYPIALKRGRDGYVATFPDVPEAITGAARRAAALDAAADALVAALGGYVEAGRDPAAVAGREVVCVPPLVAAKLALYTARQETGISNTALGMRLGVSEGAVRRLLDLDHRSHIGQVEAALAALGKRLVVDVAEAA
ncbi:MAG: helix-turn-helix domain-containing protein [Pseudomonadota bacterium]